MNENRIPPKLAGYFNDYAAFHKTFGNKLTHYFGIPAIMVTLLGLLGNLPIAGGLTQSEMIRLDGGILLWAAAIAWYLVLDWKLAIPFSLTALGMYFVGRSMPMPMLWTFFVLGWVAQFVGHYVYEKKSPAFFKNLEHVLIGPFWIFASLVGYHRS